MARITVEDCLRKENNRHTLVILASKRAKQIVAGAQPTIGDTRNNKPVVVALREVAEGSVRFMNIEEEAVEAQRKIDEKKMSAQTEKAREQLQAIFGDSGSNGGSKSGKNDDDDE